MHMDQRKISPNPREHCNEEGAASRLLSAEPGAFSHPKRGENRYHALIQTKKPRNVMYPTSLLWYDVTESRFLHGVRIHMNMQTGQGQKLSSLRDHCHDGVDFLPTPLHLVLSQGWDPSRLDAFSHLKWGENRYYALIATNRPRNELGGFNIRLFERNSEN